MVHEALTWNGETRHLLLHGNGEEWLVLEPGEEGRIRGYWITDIGRENLLAMGWSKAEIALPQPMLELASKVLPQDREPPSVILEGLRRGIGSP